MDAERNESDLKKAVQDVIHAEQCLRELANQVKGYPEAAQRLGEVSTALHQAADSLATVASAISSHERSMQQAVHRIDDAVGRIEVMRSSILAAVEKVSSSVDRQTPLLNKAAGKRGIVF